MLVEVGYGFGILVDCCVYIIYCGIVIFDDYDMFVFGIQVFVSVSGVVQIIVIGLCQVIKCRDDLFVGVGIG